MSSSKRLTKKKEKKMEGMEKRTHRRYDLSDKLWNETKRLLPDFDDTF
jgi:hypothetical protein